MPVIGSSTASSDLGRRSMMAMKSGESGLGIPPGAFDAMGERVRILEDRLAACPTRAELRRMVGRAVVVGAVIGAVAGCGLAVVVGRLVG